MVRSVAAWMTLGCLATAHLVGVVLRVPAEHRLGRSMGAALAGLAVGAGAAFLFRRFGPSPAASPAPEPADEERAARPPGGEAR